jgi:hypothetical protein
VVCFASALASRLVMAFSASALAWVMSGLFCQCLGLDVGGGGLFCQCLGLGVGGLFCRYLGFVFSRRVVASCRSSREGVAALWLVAMVAAPKEGQSKEQGGCLPSSPVRSRCARA